MLALTVFITTIIYRYQQKQNIYFKDIETLKAAHENALLQSQLEIQEQTFQNISREIHDNIGQKLTLAKLYLNTLDQNDQEKSIVIVNDSVSMISEAINDLTDISRSMSSEIILNNGFIKALEYEVRQLERSGIYDISLSITGDTIFLSESTELLLFRIVQEAVNNIIKHATAKSIGISLLYELDVLTMEISDNGIGFDSTTTGIGTGLQNIKKRAAMLKGSLEICSKPGNGTKIKIEIPYENNAVL